MTRINVKLRGSEVTEIVARNIAAGSGNICCMARVAKADVIPVDMGMLRRTPDEPRILCRHIADGTKDMTEGPAMTREEAIAALCAGIDLVGELKARGYSILITGEMGIGNTTTSSAVVSVLLDRPAAEVTGRGAGLSNAGLGRKIAAIEKAIEVNRPDPADPLDVLAKVGGFDIAGMAGLFLGGAVHRLPILIDGFISEAAALLAARIDPNACSAMLATHISAEPAAHMVMDALGLQPMITAGLRLGEGTGAIAALPLLDMALAVYHSMDSFGDIGVEAYTPQ